MKVSGKTIERKIENSVEARIQPSFTPFSTTNGSKSSHFSPVILFKHYIHPQPQNINYLVSYSQSKIDINQFVRDTPGCKVLKGLAFNQHNIDLHLQ